MHSYEVPEMLAFDVVAGEADVDVVVEGDDGDLAVDHVLGALEQAEALVGVGLLRGLGAEVVELGAIPVAIVLETVGFVFVGEGGGVGIIAVPGGDADGIVFLVAALLKDFAFDALDAHIDAKVGFPLALEDLGDFGAGGIGGDVEDGHDGHAAAVGVTRFGEQTFGVRNIGGDAGAVVAARPRSPLCRVRVPSGAPDVWSNQTRVVAAGKAVPGWTPARPTRHLVAVSCCISSAKGRWSPAAWRAGILPLRRCLGPVDSTAAPPRPVRPYHTPAPARQRSTPPVRGSSRSLLTRAGEGQRRYANHDAGDGHAGAGEPQSLAAPDRSNKATAEKSEVAKSSERESESPLGRTHA